MPKVFISEKQGDYGVHSNIYNTGSSANIYACKSDSTIANKANYCMRRLHGLQFKTGNEKKWQNKYARLLLQTDTLMK